MCRKLECLCLKVFPFLLTLKTNRACQETVQLALIRARGLRRRTTALTPENVLRQYPGQHAQINSLTLRR